jgi:hypothetical protein
MRTTARTDVVGAARPGGRSPERAAAFVSEGEKVQAMTALFAGVVPPVGSFGAAQGADEGAVDQDHLPPRLATFFRAWSRRGACAASSAISSSRQRRTGRLGLVVAARHAGQALVVTQHGQDDHRDLAGRQDPPPGPYLLQGASQ